MKIKVAKRIGSRLIPSIGTNKRIIVPLTKTLACLFKKFFEIRYSGIARRKSKK